MRAARIAFALVCSLTSFAAQAAQVSKVVVRGLDEAMTANVRAELSLEEAIGKQISDRRLDYLLEEAETETRQALEPFGLYSPDIRITRSSDRNALVVTIDVTPGAPVRVGSANVGIEGEGASDQYLQRDVANARPARGEVFEHEVYEANKANITRRLAERGYFDADFLAHRVEVTRATGTANIDLRWKSGARYDMGRTTFVQDPKEIIDPRLLQRLVYWDEGDYYHQGRLDRLRKSLVSLDYFNRINIEPHPDQAVDKRVPVTVTLEPAKRSIYTAGVSYGTDSGPGFRLGVERRYLNKKGHKALGQIDYARKRKTATLQYRVPAFKWLDGWYAASAQFADEQTRYIDNRRLELAFSRTGQINNNLDASVSLHLLRERWAYGEHSEDNAYTYASMIYPQVMLNYVSADDRLYPRRGIGATLRIRGGTARGSGSFLQNHVRLQWFKGLGPQDRLILRGEAGHTFGKDALVLPPSLRLFAGGDRSIRGYNWREVGPRLNDAKGRYAFAIGARNVVTASAEYERYFNKTWGGAFFVDGGSAFNGRKVDWHTGVGIGLRWRSPVGPVRVDIARGLKQPDSPFTLHLNIGADL